MKTLFDPGMARNVTLYPWFKFFQNLIFWQSVWFLFFQQELSAAEALLLYVIYDVATTALEVPSGYMSDRWGRKRTLVVAMLAGLAGMVLLSVGGSFAVFALAQVVIGAGAAFASGTDSAFLYESLVADGRGDDVEAQTTRAWQFTLTGLAVSAISGGVMAGFAFELAFVAAALALLCAAVMTFWFTEPPHAKSAPDAASLRGQLALLGDALRQPVLAWLFVLSMLMYGFGHVPFVFGQPFIAQALAAGDWQAGAPVVSGAVSTAMMVVSVLASLVALRMRRWLGLPAILLLAFGMQITLIGALALTDSAIVIAVLLMRMVPDSLSYPFIEARIQPLLSDAGRATFLSLQSFAGRLLFAGSIFAASLFAPTEGTMAYADIRTTLAWYAIVGLVLFGGLLVAARRIAIEKP
jgi:MFS family permease